MHLQVRQLLSQYYYFPNRVSLVPAEILHNNTQACINYKKFVR